MLGDGALRSALNGRATRERFEETATFNPEIFNARDHATLDSSWATMGEDAGRASADGPGGSIADDLAFVAPWGFAIEQISVPVLIVHGGDDRVIPLSHGEWLVQQLPNAELWLRPRDGHIAILDACPLAMDWLRQHA
jgi:pimeloyl-ACP methyl ester carboxylesterase